MEKKILFLDFDGVLFDTLYEVYLVNRYEFLKKDLFEPVEEDFYARFSKYKYLVYNIWMFYYYNPLIFNCEENIPEKFNYALLNRDLEAEQEFCEKFLETRRKLVLNHYEFWKGLEKPYDFFFEIKKIKEEKNINLLIVSKKNKSSILERFEAYDFKLDSDLVYACEALKDYSSKGEFMEEYMNKHGLSEAIFVDDNNNNLLTTNNNPKIKNILALWGNTQPNSVGLSQKEAVETIKNFFK